MDPNFPCQWQNEPFPFFGHRARIAAAAVELDTDPKRYIHLIRIVATIMKHWTLISLLFMLLAGSGEGTMYLYGGSDAYGQALSYPAYGTPLALTTLVPGNNTTVVSPALLRATIFRPEFIFQKYQNATGYYHPILPIWNQFTFYLPFLSREDWSFGSYNSYVPTVKNFLKDDWSGASPDYDTAAVRQFMQSDGYHEGVEPHNDPDRLGINHFLDDDEPPGRPLL